MNLPYICNFFPLSGKFGKIEKLDLKLDGDKNSRGFCFITFIEAKGMEEALAAGSPILDEKEVIISKAIPYKDKMKTNRLFVGGIREPLIEDNLKTYFSTYGTVQSIKLIPENKHERRKGFAFIEFDTQDAVEQVVDKKNPPRGQRHEINGVRVDCQKTYPEDHPAYKKIKKLKEDMRSRYMYDYDYWQYGGYDYAGYGYGDYGYNYGGPSYYYGPQGGGGGGAYYRTGRYNNRGGRINRGGGYGGGGGYNSGGHRGLY